MEADYILQLWLDEVPEYTALFFKLSLLGILVDLPGAPLTTLALATGKIKRFYIWMGLLGCLVFPVSYVLFFMGAPAYSSYVVYAIVYTYLVQVRLSLMNKQVNFPITKFYLSVILPIIKVTI